MTDTGASATILNEIKEAYYSRTVRSREKNTVAVKFLPGGDTRAATYFAPYPTHIVHGDGCYVFDADGNRYLDFLNNFTQQVLGHNNPSIKKAVIEQLEHGTIFGAPHESQAKLAEELCKRIPCFQKVRFCNSGTEATMFAIKGARAFTGKSKIIKVEGMYHGTHDLAEASIFPPLDMAGDPESPWVVPYNKGIPPNTFENVIVVPFNNTRSLEMAIDRNRGEIAAMIMEPIMTAAGLIPATEEYLTSARKLTENEEIVLIFDEVVTFRLSPGGAQELYGVIPDMTTVGKFIGGGFPIGAFGGNDEIMSIFSPPDDVFSASAVNVKHSGTFNGHPVIMSSGMATMKELTPDVYQRMNSLGDLFRQRLNTEVFEDLGVVAQATGWGSLLFIHYTLDGLNNYRDARLGHDAAGELPVYVHLDLLNNGIWIAERGEIALSAPMMEENIDEAVEAYRKTFAKILPFLRNSMSHLIRS